MTTLSDGSVRADANGWQIISDKLDAALDATFPSSDPVSATQRHAKETLPSHVVRLKDFKTVPTECPFVLVREQSELGAAGFKVTWWCEPEDTPGRIHGLFCTLEPAICAAQDFAEAHSIAVVHVLRTSLFELPQKAEGGHA